MTGGTSRDLVVLAADKHTEFSIKGILARPESLRIAPVDCEIFVHPEHDPGCLHKSPQFLRPYQPTHRHALVVFDREGCGCEDCSRQELEAQIESALSRSGWEQRAAAVVIEPELEAWVWSESPHVDRVLGWSEDLLELRAWLQDQGFVFRGQKADRPKEAMEAVLRRARKARSSAVFQELATRVSFERCADPAFLKLREVLSRWFPR